MSRSLIKLSAICTLFLLSGCGFIDLRPIDYSTFPETAYSLIEDPYCPVGIGFDTAMKKKETENILQVQGPQGSIEGEFSWSGNKLFFHPTAPWSAGLRYVMKLSGTTRSEDGRELYISREVPFYAVSRSAQPYLVSFSPADGASTGCYSQNETVLGFVFSQPMDRKSTELAFSCDGLAERIFEWTEEDMILEVLSTNSFSPWTSCKWTITEKALSKDGAPLAKEYSGRFITNIDKEFPKLLRAIPLIKSEIKTSWGYWQAADFSLENGLGAGQAIGMEFSKDMDSESIRKAFRFEPAISGRTEQPLPSRAVYIPDRNTEPETVYTMHISGELRDTGGLKMEEALSINFISDIQFLKILSFSPYDSDDFLDPQNNEIIPVPISDSGGGVLRYTIRFSLPLSKQEQNEAVFRISLQTFFPGTLKPVTLRWAYWIMPNLLSMEWEGLEAGIETEPHLYRLILPGGSTGIADGKGSYLKENTAFIIKAVEL